MSLLRDRVIVRGSYNMICNEAVIFIKYDHPQGGIVMKVSDWWCSVMELILVERSCTKPSESVDWTNTFESPSETNEWNREGWGYCMCVRKNCMRLKRSVNVFAVKTNNKQTKTTQNKQTKPKTKQKRPRTDLFPLLWYFVRASAFAMPKLHSTDSAPRFSGHATDHNTCTSQRAITHN